MCKINCISNGWLSDYDFIIVNYVFVAKTSVYKLLGDSSQ